MKQEVYLLELAKSINLYYEKQTENPLNYRMTKLKQIVPNIVKLKSIMNTMRLKQLRNI